MGFLELFDTAATLDGECALLFDVSLDLLAECELPAIRLARLCFAPGARGRGRPVSRYCAVELVKKYFHCVVPQGGRGPRQVCVNRAMGTLLAELPPRCHEDGAGLLEEWGDRRWSAPLCSGVNVEEVKEIYHLERTGPGVDLSGEDPAELEAQAAAYFRVLVDHFDDRRECKPRVDATIKRIILRHEGGAF